MKDFLITRFQYLRLAVQAFLTIYDVKHQARFKPVFNEFGNDNSKTVEALDS
jgi:hypothetical protein